MTKKELIADRDDWQKIAEMNSDVIDRLRAQIEEMHYSIRDRRNGRVARRYRNGRDSTK